MSLFTACHFCSSDWCQGECKIAPLEAKIKELEQELKDAQELIGQLRLRSMRRERSS